MAHKTKDGTKTAAALADDIADHRASLATSTAELARLDAERPALMANEDATETDLEEHDHLADKMRRRIERATAMLDKLVPRWERADVDEKAVADAQHRKALYARGRAAAVEYERLVLKEYGPAAAKVAVVLKAMAAQKAIVRAANEAIPEGRDPLDAEAFRQPPYDPGTRPADRIVDENYWVDEDGRECSAPAMYGHPGAMKPTTMGVTLKTRRKKVKSDWAPAQRETVISIEYGARLPQLTHAEPDFWWQGEPMDHSE